MYSRQLEGAQKCTFIYDFFSTFFIFLLSICSLTDTPTKHKKECELN